MLTASHALAALGKMPEHFAGTDESPCRFFDGPRFRLHTHLAHPARPVNRKVMQASSRAGAVIKVK